MSKITEKQKKVMISFMEANVDFGRGKSSKEETVKLWNKLSNILNAIGGAVKTVKQWRKTWCDIKVDAKRKHAYVRCAIEKTGGGSPPPEMNQDSTHDRILSVIGSAVVDGIKDATEIGFDCSTVREVEESEAEVYLPEPSSMPSTSKVSTLPQPRNQTKRMHTDRWLRAQESQAKSQEAMVVTEKRKVEALEDMASSFKRIATYLENYWSSE